MSENFTSVDDFVAAYLANFDPASQASAPAPASAPATNGLPFAGANGLQPMYQQQSCLPSVPAASQPCQLTALQPSCATKVEPCGDVYMQPYDQALQQSYPQLGQQVDWQLQQQQLYLLQQQQQQLLGMPAPDLNMGTAGAGAAAAVEQQVTPKASRRADTTKPAQQQQIVANGATTGKRNSRSKSSSCGGRRSKQDAATDEAVLLPDADAGVLCHDMVHVNSAPPLLGSGPAGLVAAAAAAAPVSQRSLSSSMSAGYTQPGNLSSSMAALRQAQNAQQVHAEAVAQQAPPSLLQEADEPDMSHMTVMQRYHARRKLAVQRMEREVEEKIAQLAELEQENRQLKWQAHILENMLLDMDKQVELMSAEELPDTSQWITLLGMSTHAASGGTGRITRRLDRMLEGASAVNIDGWTAQDCRAKWLSFLEQLRPLVQEAEAAQAAYKAAHGATAEQQSKSSAQQPQRRPRRAAAAVAAAVIKQEAAEVLGVPPLPVSAVQGSIPDIPVRSLSRSPGNSSPQVVAASGAAEAAGSSSQPMEDVQRTHSSSSNSNLDGVAVPAGSEQSGGSMGGSELSHGPNAEGVPLSVLTRIEELMMHTFYWLLAIMTRNPVLTYEFISMDLVEGRTPLPPQRHQLWADAVERAELSLEQQQECTTCLQVSRRCMAKVIEERSEITAAMQSGVRRPQTDAHSLAWLASDMLNQNQVDATVERMRANVRKESVVRNLVGFYCINVISLYQLAKVSLSCSPWFCMAWRIADAAEVQLARHLAGEAASQQQQNQAGRHNTRSSARLAAAQH